MSARAPTGSFLREAAAGFVLSIAAGALGAALGFVLPAGALARVLVAALGLVCVVRVLTRSRENTGRVVTLVLWCAAAAGLELGGAGLPAYVAAHAALLSVVRSLFLHRRLIEAALDGGLTLLALGFAAWAAARADSVFLAAWCFFLVQAMHVAIPALADRLVRAGASPATCDADTAGHAANRRFTDALGAADEALRRIAARR